MNRLEINEIKKLLKMGNCSIDYIYGCYVCGTEKQVKAVWRQPFHSLPEEDMQKWLDILRKILSGKLEKDLKNVPMKANLARQMHCSYSDSDIMEDCCMEIINEYEYQGNYLILMVHDAYDIPGRATDNMEMADASEEVYEYILLCICPVCQEESQLGFDAGKGIFGHTLRDWIVSVPVAAVLYPAFNGRSADFDNCLCYCHKIGDESTGLLERLTGSSLGISAESEKEAFLAILQDGLGEDATLEVIRDIQERIREIHAEGKYAGGMEPQKLGVEDITVICRESGVNEANMESLKAAYASAMGGGSLTVDNIVNNGKFEVKTRDHLVRCNPGNAQDVRIVEIDGQKFVAVPVTEGTEVNSITIKG